MTDTGVQSGAGARRRPCVLVCQYRSCQRSGAAAVLASFQALDLPPGTFAMASGCLGQCGSGPNVVVSPDNFFYCHVRPSDVETIVNQHLHQGQPVRSLLHPRLHGEYDVYSTAQFLAD